MQARRRQQLQKLWRRLAADCRGQDMIEYALMASVVAVAVGAFLPPMGDMAENVFSKVVSVLGPIVGS